MATISCPAWPGLLNKDVQLDLSISHGISQSAVDAGIGVGLSVRY
jgi:hypothetical protein